MKSLGLISFILILLGSACSEHAELSAAENQVSQALLATPVKLMTYNIKNSFGCNDALCVDDSFYKTVEAIAAEAPDVVAIQEIGFRMRQADYEDQLTNMAQYLSDLTGLNYQVHYFGYKDLTHQHPGRIDLWGTSHGPVATDGDAIITHHELYGIAEDVRMNRDILSLDHDDDLPNNGATGAVRLTLNFSSTGLKLIDFYGIHLQSNESHKGTLIENNAHVRLEQLHALERFIRKDRPAFLMGDLNARLSEVSSWSDWKTTQSSELNHYPSFGTYKQIDWILYRNFKEHNNVSVYESKDANGDSYILSDHTPLVLEGDFTACDVFDPANIVADFCGTRQSGQAQCRLCGVGEGTCQNDGECAGNLVCGGSGLCEAPTSNHILPKKITGYSSPAPYPGEWVANINSPSDDMYSLAVRYAPTTGQLDSLWLTIDGVRVARQIETDNTAGSWRTVVFKHIPISAGDHVLTLHSEYETTNVKHLRFFYANANPYELLPFPLSQGTLEAERFDVKGYSATSAGNQGNYPRYEDVDIYQDEERTYVELHDEDNVSYSIEVLEEATFDVTLRLKADSTDHITLDFDRVVIYSANVSSSSQWQEILIEDVVFKAGTHKLTLDSLYGIKLDSFYFKQTHESGSFKGEPWEHGEVIQAEFFDLNAFSDTDDKSLDEIPFRYDADGFGNAPDLWHFEGPYAPFDPELNSYFVWKTAPNEYLEYSIGPGTTNDCIDLVYATPNAGSEICAELDGVSLGCVIPAPTPGWGVPVLGGLMSTWGLAQILNVDTSAGGLLRIIFKDGGINLDSIQVH